LFRDHAVILDGDTNLHTESTTPTPIGQTLLTHRHRAHRFVNPSNAVPIAQSSTGLLSETTTPDDRAPNVSVRVRQIRAFSDHDALTVRFHWTKLR
jgi:hypothetical protein